MFAIIILFQSMLVVVLSNNLNNFGEKPSRRLFYADLARIEDFPYFASLGHCGGVIISNLWILTAAHCVIGLPTLGPIWVGGNTIPDSERYFYNKYIIHPQYQVLNGMRLNNDILRGVQVNDIALVKLSNPLKYTTKIQPVRLPTGNPPRDVITIGRGKDETGQATFQLKKLPLILLSTQECLAMVPGSYQGFANINRKFLEKVTLCAKRQGNLPSVCSGDSGSPLISGNTLVGLSSYTNKNCQQQKQAYFTNVLTYVPWIRALTGI